MKKWFIRVLFPSIFTMVSMYLLLNYIDSITLALQDNRLNIQILVELIRKLKGQLLILFSGGVIYTSIFISLALFIDKKYPSDKHKDVQ